MARKPKPQIAVPVADMLPGASPDIAPPVASMLPDANAQGAPDLPGYQRDPFAAPAADIAPPVASMLPEAQANPPNIAPPVKSLLPDANEPPAMPPALTKPQQGLSETEKSALWVAALQGHQPAIDKLAANGISVKDYQAKARAGGQDLPGPALPVPPQRPASDAPVISHDGGPAPQSSLSPSDRDYLIRTVYGEANGQPMLGMQAVANVVLNRVHNGWGSSVQDVVTQPWQFEPWMTRSRELLSLDPNSEAYKTAALAVDAALKSGYDPTNGADHFLNPDIVRGRTGGRLPAWAQGTASAVIGQHAFFTSSEKPAALRVAPMMAQGQPLPAGRGGVDLLTGSEGTQPIIGDAADDYLAYRQVAGADDVISQALARQQARQKAVTQSAAPSAGIYPADADKVQAAQSVIAPETAPPPVQGPATWEEVWRGLKESPGAAVGGVFDAAREVAKAAGYIADQIDFEHPSGGKNPLVDAIDAVDPTSEPTSGGGKTVRALTNFAAPFAYFAKAAGKVIKGEGLFAKISKGAAAGALTGAIATDPFEPGISNLVQSFPALQNPVTEYLQAKPDDTEGEARLKKGLENAGFGVLSDAMLQGFRAIKSWRAARGAAPQTGEEAAAAQTAATAEKAGGEMPAGAFKILGDPEAPLVSAKPAARPSGDSQVPTAADLKLAQAAGETETGVPGQVAAKGTLAHPAGDFYVNFSRIQSEEDVKSVIGTMADAFKPQLDVARRGVQSFGDTKALADEMGLTVDDLLKRQQGQPFNAETALAARQLLTASGEKLLETAKAAASPNATGADLYAFRRMMALHYAVQTEVIAARTETARALSSWRIPAGAAEQSKAIQQMLDGAGGGEVVTREMAKRLAQIGEVNPDALAQAVRKGWGAKTMDAVRTFYVNAMLSSPTTHIVNTMSNAAVAFQQVYERAAGRGFSSLRGDATGIAPGEATAMMFGTVQSIKDAFRYAWQTQKTGISSFGASKIEQAAATGETQAMATQTGFGRFADYMGRFLPTRAMQSEDEFFKIIGYRAEVSAQAVRQAYREGLTGDAYKTRVAQLMTDPPESIRLEAADAALYRTFNQKLGPFGQRLMAAREAAPYGTGWLVVPFMRTPANIFKYSMERTPLAITMKSWQEDFMAGGARRDLALAKASTGTAIMLTTMDYSDKGLVTGFGPDDPAHPEIRQGWLRTHQPWSVKVGDRWVSYNRMDPLGMTLGLAATMNEQLSKLDYSGDGADATNQAIAGTLTAIADSVVNKTYLQSFAGLVNAIEQPEQSASGYIDQLLGGFVPAVSGTAERIVDPTSRDTLAIGDAARAKIIGLSDQLPPRRDLWGQALPYESGYGSLYDAMTPMATQKVRQSPIDTEMERLQIGVKQIPKKVDWDGVPVNMRDFPAVLDAYRRLAGSELKIDHGDGPQGLKDYLDGIVGGKGSMSQVYKLGSDGEDGGKAMMIRQAVQEYRASAREAIMADPKFRAFADFIQAQKAAKEKRDLDALQGVQ